jgi:hypothetical protein
LATIYQSKSEKLKIKINKYFSLSYYKGEIKSWNKVGKIKSFLILLNSILTLITFKFSEDLDTFDNSELIITSFIGFIFGILFLIFITKLWSWFGFEFKKPNWNDNPISFNFSKSLNFFHFIGYCFVISEIIRIIYVGIFYQKFEKENIFIIFAGIGLIIGIKLSLKLLNKNGNKKTVANTV